MRKALCVAILLGLSVPSAADAFCGFYVSGADAKLFNNATQVVLMREGTRTVLSMSNNYQGPTSDFAMVVPVPVILQKENVKTLEKKLFERVDQLTAPRLVEYWEQDPCEVMKFKGAPGGGGLPRPRLMAPAAEKRADDLGVTVEAKFTVGEYDIVILSAKDATGLDTWLRQEKYKIPEGADAYLRPYVTAGSKFFVAKVDAQKVKFEGGMAQLSPLRFHYDSESFSLPIRLGLMNSQGTQDLIVHILAQGQRYEVANYPNATIPTNFDLSENAKGQFGSFYAALFDRTLEKIPKVIVTEYSWDARSCDPCPSPPLTQSEINVLGADVLPSSRQQQDFGEAPRGRRVFGGGSFVLTRLHARYGKDNLGEDLVFRAATPIVGGREMRMDGKNLEHGATASSVNNFQGRYAIRHPWTGPITCANPQRGIWGGPPGKPRPDTTPATNLAFVPRGKVQLATMVKGAVPEVVALPGTVTPLGSPVVPVPASPPSTAAVDAAAAPSASAEPADAGATPPVVPPGKSGCGCDVAGAPASTAGGLFVAAMAIVARIKRRRRS